MAHRRGSFRGRGISESQRRKKLWNAFSAGAVDDTIQGTVQQTTLNFAATGVLAPASGDSAAVAFVFDAGNAAGNIAPESTLMRIRGSLNIDKNTVTATDLLNVAFGIGVMESGAANQSAFPIPSSAAGSDWDGWMFYRSLNSAVADATGSMVDVKAMRKIQSGYSLFFVVSATIVSFDDGAPAANINFDAQFTGRGLFLLP